MTDIELKNLKDNLWHSADMLRAGAHLAANKYGQPILGLIFLRYADVLFKQHKAEIDEEYNRYKGSRMEREYKDIAVEKCGFFLPECAYFDTINDAPDDAHKAALVMANSASDAGDSELEIRKKMIQDGIISQMVTLPSNMFSTVTLPATLWFFNKQRTKKDEILFIDARNIFTQVDRAHRKFSDEQIKNLGIITRLYEGDGDAFWALVDEYKAAGKQEEVDWLLERWPEGKYRDVIGLCKVAKITGEDGIEDNDWSLNAGRYVGVVIEDDGMTESEFRDEMLNLNGEFSKLSAEAEDLQKEIEKNMVELFGEE